MSDRFYQILYAFFITSITFAVMGAAYRHPHTNSFFLTAGLLLVTVMVGLLCGSVSARFGKRAFTAVLLAVLVVTGANNYAMIAGSFTYGLAELALGYGVGFLFGRFVVLRMRHPTVFKPI